MNEADLTNDIVSMTLMVGTKYSDEDIRGFLSEKNTEELQVVHARVKRRYDKLFPKTKVPLDEVEGEQ